MVKFLEHFSIVYYCFYYNLTYYYQLHNCVYQCILYTNQTVRLVCFECVEYHVQNAPAVATVLQWLMEYSINTGFFTCVCHSGISTAHVCQDYV